MQRKILVGIWVTAFLLMSACGTESDEDVVSLEPHPLEIAGSGGELNSAAAGTGAVPFSAGRESDTSAAISGKGDAGNGTGVTESDTGAESGQDVLTSAADPGTRSAAGGSSGTYGDVYLRKINENESTARIYSLIYLDADEIPELVIDMGDESYSIYTVKEDELFCMADSVGTVELTYFEKSGIIAVFSRWNGGGDEGGYGSSYYRISGDRTLTYDDQPVLSYSYNAVYNEKGEYTGTGVTDYFYMEQEIDEATYQEKMKSLGIAEGEDRLCMENSYSKEEITVLLNQ